MTLRSIKGRGSNVRASTTFSLHPYNSCPAPTDRYSVPFLLPPSMNSNPLSDVFKAKVTSLILDQLKPIVTELAVQHQMLQTHLALLKHNHNVNDYQMIKLENIRDLEQSIKYAFVVILLPDPSR